MKNGIRNSGLEIVGNISWGTHFSQFYQTEEDLIEIIIPYFKAGLESNESCLWITSDIIGVREAEKILRELISNIDVYFEKGQIKIISFTDFYSKEGILDSQKALDDIIKRANQALISGHNGLRLAENICSFKKEKLDNLIVYEERLNSVIGEYPIITLCTYSLEMCSSIDTVEIAANHDFVLVKKKDRWEQIKNAWEKNVANLKRMGEMLQESEHREHERAQELATLFDMVPIPVFIVHDPDSSHITGNLAADELLHNPCRGVEASLSASTKKRPRHFKAIKDGREPSTDELPAQRAARGFQVQDFEFSLVFDDGTRKEVIGYGNPLLDENGRPRGAVHVLVDITKRKRAEEELLYYASLVDNVSDAIISTDKELKFQSWNRAAERMYGWQEDEVIGLKGSDVLYTTFPEGISREAIAKDIFEKGSWEGELIQRTKDGRDITVYAKSMALKDEAGDVIGGVSISSDITERKQAEELLAYQANLLANISDVVYSTDDQLRLVSWNQAAEKVYGWKKEEVLGKNVIEVTGSTFNPEMRARLITELQERGSITAEIEHTTISGEHIIFDSNTMPLRDAGGKVVGYVAVNRNITESKKNQKVLLDLETTRQKEIHHRIKNNLQVISSLLELQSEQFKNREFIKDSEILGAFKESQNRVISIALIHEELHEVERTDEINFSLYLQRLAKNLFQSYNIGNANIILNTDFEEDLLLDMDTVVPLGMIVNEVISNSFKYAFSGRNEGEIQIKLHRREDTKDGNTGYVLNILDNGIGIPENINFEDPDTLGLQLINILVDQIDGCIELKRDQGTEFIIWFNNIEK